MVIIKGGKALMGRLYFLQAWEVLENENSRWAEKSDTAIAQKTLYLHCFSV